MVDGRKDGSLIRRESSSCKRRRRERKLTKPIPMWAKNGNVCQAATPALATARAETRADPEPRVGTMGWWWADEMCENERCQGRVRLSRPDDKNVGERRKVSR